MNTPKPLPRPLGKPKPKKEESFKEPPIPSKPAPAALDKKLDTPLVPSAPSKESQNLESLSEVIAEVQGLLDAACPTSQIQSAMLVVQQQLNQHEYLADILLPEDIGTCVSALQEIHNARLEQEFAKKPKRKTAKKKAASKPAPKPISIDLDGLGL